MSKTMVYLISDGKYVKIGYTSGPAASRLRALQTGASQRLRLLGEFNGTAEDERRLHAEFSAKRRIGEWFDLSDEDVRAIVVRGAYGVSGPTSHNFGDWPDKVERWLAYGYKRVYVKRGHGYALYVVLMADIREYVLGLDRDEALTRSEECLMNSIMDSFGWSGGSYGLMGNLGGVGRVGGNDPEWGYHSLAAEPCRNPSRDLRGPHLVPSRRTAIRAFTPTFSEWIRLQAGRDDIVGDFADDWVRHPLGEPATWSDLLTATRNRTDNPSVLCAARAAWFEHQRGLPTKLVRRQQGYAEGIRSGRAPQGSCCWLKDGAHASSSETTTGAPPAPR